MFLSHAVWLCDKQHISHTMINRTKENLDVVLPHRKNKLRDGTWLRPGAAGREYIRRNEKRKGDENRNIYATFASAISKLIAHFKSSSSQTAVTFLRLSPGEFPWPKTFAPSCFVIIFPAQKASTGVNSLRKPKGKKRKTNLWLMRQHVSFGFRTEII